MAGRPCFRESVAETDKGWMQLSDSPAKAMLSPWRGVPRWLTGWLGDDALQRRLARGALTALLINALGMTVGLLAQLVLTRSLGAEGYGVYAYVLGWVNLLIVPAMLGFGTAQLRYVAQYRARAEWGLIRGVTTLTDRLVASTGLTITLGGILTVWLLREILAPALVDTFYIGLFMIPVLALMATRAATVRALGHVVAAIAPDRLVRHLATLTGVGGLALLLPGPMEPVTAALVSLAAALLSLRLISRSRSRALPPAVLQTAPLRQTQEWFTTAVPLLLMASALSLSASASLLVLGWLGDTTDVGVYAVAAGLALFLSFPLEMVSFVFAPTIAHLHARGEYSELQGAVTATAWWATAGAVAVGVPLFLFPGVCLALFGEEFVSGETALRIILLAGLVHAATGSVGYLMTMTGLERQATVLATTAAFVNVACAFLLIPPFGLVGAAVATAAGIIVWNVMAVVWSWRRLGIVAGIFASLVR